VSKRRKRAQQTSTRWLIVGAVVVIVLAGGSIVASAISAKPAPVLTAAIPAPLDECGSSECGQANAPVTIEIYADFQCPYCARADTELQQIAQKYIDTGKARLVYHAIAIIGTESNWAAQAAECAGEQNKFWAYGNYLFTHQGSENTGTFSMDNLKRFAVPVGLDQNTFNACLNSGKYSGTVQQQTGQAEQRGVQATPTFFINGQKYEGVLTAAQLSSLIDAKVK
jgi:protein-disulfide isomerase